MKMKNLLIIGVLTAGIAFTGCQSTGKVENQKVDDAKIMTEFNGKIEAKDKLSDIIVFADKNIAKFSKENAETVVLKIEELEKANFDVISEKFYADDIQAKFLKESKDVKEMNNLNVKDTQVKSLIEEAKANGFKMETAEGMYFPVIDYKMYEKYTTNLPDDMKEYVKIMSIESENTPEKDAGIVISWKEVVERALGQEAFITKYADSKKIADVKNLYNGYVMRILFGSNNTPTFDYENDQLKEEVKSIYAEYAAKTGTEKTIKLIKDFNEVLKKNEYKLNKPVDDYRREAYKNLTGDELIAE